MRSKANPAIYTCGSKTREPERIAYVFQGGGALGSFQVGVIQALHEYDYCPDIVSGISIGAINAAIMAGNTRGQRLEKLIAFWDGIATQFPFDKLQSTQWCQGLYNNLGAASSIFFGQAGFFTPRMSNLFLKQNAPLDEISFYDLAPLRETLLALIDFDLINTKAVPLYLGAVCVETGSLKFFCNETDIITPEHVMASASLPPSFGAIKIKDRHYWDGAVYANTPLTAILDAKPERNTLCFAVNCFSAAGSLPDSLDSVEQRIKEIRYSSHLSDYVEAYSRQQNFRCIISHLADKIPTNEKDDPMIQALLSEASPKLVQIVQLNYTTNPADHASKDYNFARNALDDHRQNGYETACKALTRKPWATQPESYIGAVVYEEENCGIGVIKHETTK